MLDSARSSPASANTLRRAKSDAADAGAGLRLQSVRTLALAFLCGALYAVGMMALSGGGLASWREGAPPLPPPADALPRKRVPCGRASCSPCSDLLHMWQFKACLQ